jgi:drug/metabolite transporter (DMT)-like permease
MTSANVIAVVVSLLAACSFGVAAALQHQQAHQVDGDGTVRVGLLADLLRQPRWLASIATAAMAYVLQAVALSFGPITLVAPVVAMDLLFALPLAAWWSRRRLRRRDWAGCGLVASGVGIFLASSPPAAGRSDAPAREWLAVFGAVAIIIILAVVAAGRSSDATRALLLAAAAGVLFGLLAAVTLSFTRLLRGPGLAAALGHWQPWALIALGVIGLLLSQSAFQSGALTASLPVIDTLEPISGVLIGVLIFDERLAASSVLLMAQLAGAVAAVVGIMLLTPGRPEPDAGRGHCRQA